MNAEVVIPKGWVLLAPGVALKRGDRGFNYQWHERKLPNWEAVAVNPSGCYVPRGALYIRKLKGK